MTTLQRRLYAWLISIHPAAFRNEFGREMALDSEAALATTGFASLCFDALTSVARQWAACAMPAASDQAPARKLSLLSGDYVMISPGGPTLPNVAKASLLSMLLLYALAFGVTGSNHRRTIDLPVGSGNQPGGIHSPAHNQPHSAGRSLDAASDVFGTRSPGSPSQGHGARTGNTQGPWLRGRVPQAEAPATIDTALISYLLHSAIFATLIWLTTVLLYLRPVIGRKIALALFGMLAFAGPLAFAQILHPDGPLPSFEVATIKPFVQPQVPLPPPPPPPPESNANRRPAKIAPGNGGGVTTDIFHSIMPAQLLIAFAYNVPFGFETKRIFGAPAWLNTDAYELQGKIEASLFAAMQKMTPAQQREQVNLMEQSLLSDRFKLKVHFETREMAGYELVVAKGGPKLAPAKDGGKARLS
jgi:hypothetical protein